MKPTQQSSMFFYRVSTDAQGAQRLEQVTFHEFTSDVVETLKWVVGEFVTKDDNNLYARIAAGTAAKRILAQKIYRGAGLTKSSFCKKELGRSARTIDSYVDAAESYEAIGGLSCPVQPTSIHQLDVVASVRPNSRKDFWLKMSHENNGLPPSGEMLERRAEEEKVLLPKRKTKGKPAKVTDLPCSNLEEASAYAEAQMKQDPKGPWTKMHRFLLSLAQRAELPSPEPKVRTGKSRPIRDVRGQTFMFQEVLEPVPASVVDQLEIPKIG